MDVKEIPMLKTISAVIIALLWTAPTFAGSDEDSIHQPVGPAQNPLRY
jgi:hypothetical protein